MSPSRFIYVMWKATGLEKARQSLYKFQEDIKQSKECVPAIEEKCRLKEETYKRYKAELKELEALDKYEAEIVNLKTKLLWLEVYEADASLEKLHDAVNSKREALDAAKEALSEATDGLNSIGSIDAVKDRIDEVRMRIEEAQQEVNNRRLLVTDKSKALNLIQLDLRKLQDSSKDMNVRQKNATREVE